MPRIKQPCRRPKRDRAPAPIPPPSPPPPPIPPPSPPPPPSHTEGSPVDRAENEPEESHRRWIEEEERLLLDCFKQIIADGLKSENGFKPGYLTTLEKMIETELPGAGIKGSPHIESRMKQWRRIWSPLWDFLQRFRTAFSPQTQEIDATPEIWAELLRSNRRKYGWMKGHKFPYYEEWCLIFGKDRANGEVQVGLNDDIDSAEEAHVETPGSVGQTLGASSAPVEERANTNRKRKILNDNEVFWSRLEAMNESSNQALRAAVQSLASDPAVDRTSNIIAGMALTARQKATVSSVIINDRGVMLSFLNMTMDELAEYVQEILDGV